MPVGVKTEESQKAHASAQIEAENSAHAGEEGAEEGEARLSGTTARESEETAHEDVTAAEARTSEPEA